jgi:hypothetical protein
MTLGRSSLNDQKKTAELMLNYVLPFAKRMIEKFGELLPVCAYTNQSSEIVQLGLERRSVEGVPASLVVSKLIATLREKVKSNECVATAIAFDVKVNEPSSGRRLSAIQVNLDCEGGYSAEVFCPYLELNDGIVFRPLFSQEGRHEIFS